MPSAFDTSVANRRPKANINTATEPVAELPVAGVLLELGRAYHLAGRPGGAQAAFQRVMDEFPTSLYFTDAQRKLQALQIEG